MIPKTEAGAAMVFYLHGLLMAFIEPTDPRMTAIRESSMKRIVAIEAEAAHAALTALHREVAEMAVASADRRDRAGINAVLAEIEQEIKNLNKNSAEGICPICKAMIRLRRSGTISWHQVDGLPCRGSGRQPL